MRGVEERSRPLSPGRESVTSIGSASEEAVDGYFSEALVLGEGSSELPFQVPSFTRQGWNLAFKSDCVTAE